MTEPGMLVRLFDGRMGTVVELMPDGEYASVELNDGSVVVCKVEPSRFPSYTITLPPGWAQ